MVIDRPETVQSQFFKPVRSGRAPRQLPLATRRRLKPYSSLLQGSILEIGAGDAALARSRPDLEIISTDLVLEGLRGLGDTAAVFPLGGPFPFAEGVFDLIIAFEVFEHLSAEERARAIRESHRVLRPGGSILISVPTWPIAAGEWLVKLIRKRHVPRLTNLRQWDFPHETRFRKGQMEDELAAFNVVETHRWVRSLGYLGMITFNPLLRRMGGSEVDWFALDAIIPFDPPSNEVIVARKTPSAGSAA
jgi:SAM-dependent methyltransferase